MQRLCAILLFNILEVWIDIAILTPSCFGKGRDSTETPSKLFANHNVLGQLTNHNTFSFSEGGPSSNPELIEYYFVFWETCKYLCSFWSPVLNEKIWSLNKMRKIDTSSCSKVYIPWLLMYFVAFLSISKYIYILVHFLNEKSLSTYNSNCNPNRFVKSVSVLISNINIPS